MRTPLTWLRNVRLSEVVCALRPSEITSRIRLLFLPIRFKCPAAKAIPESNALPCLGRIWLIASSRSLSSAVRSCSKSSWLLKTRMQASSLTRRFLTMSCNVAIMACRFWLVRSEVSISIPSETASEGAAIPLGRFVGGLDAATSPRDGGSCNVSSKPKGAFFFADLPLPEASAVSVRLVGLGLLAAIDELPVDREFVLVDADRVFAAGFARPESGLGGESNAAALAT